MSPPNLNTVVERFVTHVVKKHRFTVGETVMHQLSHALADYLDLDSKFVKRVSHDRYVITHEKERVNVTVNKESAIVFIRNETIPAQGETPEVIAQSKMQIPQVTKTDEAGPSKANKKK